MPTIHPTAVVDRGAELADDVEVGPLCYVGPGVRIGAGSTLVSHVAILGDTTIGAGNVFWPQATIGAPPQDLKYLGEPTRLVIGDNNIFRESVTVHLGTAHGGGVTRVGHDSMFMVGSHIAHDCTIHDHVLLANHVLLAGHVHVHDHTVIAGASAVHHFVTIGQYVYIGGLTRIVQDCPPFMIVEGNPARVRGFNKVGLQRHQFDQASIDSIREAYRQLYRDNGEGESEVVATAEVLQRLESQFPDDECINLIVRFIRNTNIGLHGRHREATRTDDRRRNPALGSKE